MRHTRRRAATLQILLSGCFLLGLSVISYAHDDDTPAGARIPTGQRITPGAAPGSQVLRLHTDLRSDENADAANAVTTALSPDGSTLLILTSGSNNSFYKDEGTPIAYDIVDPTTGQPTGQTTFRGNLQLDKRQRFIC